MTTQDKTLNTKRTKRRTPIVGGRNVLTVQGKEPGFQYRIVNDDGDRVSQFESQGYEIVKDSNIKVGDRRVANPSQSGAPIEVSVGGGKKAFVMRIPNEFYEEDQAAKQAYVDETEKGMKDDMKKVSDYGKVTIS